MMTAVIAAGIAAFIFIYFANAINEKEHFILRLLLFSFGIILLIFLGKGAIDGQEVCELVPKNTEETLQIQGAEPFAGLTVGVASPQFGEINTDMTMIADVYNKQGVRKTNLTANCSFAVLNNQGSKIYLSNATMVQPYNYLYNITIPASFLNLSGVYSYKVFCINGTDGGYVGGELFITEFGSQELENSKYTTICYESNATTGTVLYKTLLYMFIIYVAYILFYFVYWMFNLTRKFMRK